MNTKEMTNVLEDMKVKIDIPRAAVSQRNKNDALDAAIEALNQKEQLLNLITDFRAKVAKDGRLPVNPLWGEELLGDIKKIFTV